MSSVNLKKNWEQVKPLVEHLYKSGLRLSKSETITKSKLGGKPCVDEPSFQWPYVDEVPLAFLAQLDLAELNAAFRIDWLPATGSLLFFYDVETMPWGFEPEDNQLWQVIYLAQAETEINFPNDLPQEFQFDGVYLTAIKSEQLPSLERAEAKALNLNEQQAIAYEELSDRGLGEEPSHQVSGYPDSVQTDGMELECQLVSNGLSLDDGSAYQSEKAKKLEAGASDWRLLFQLDTDEDADMMWGDCGTLYFWIKEQDARAGDFSKTWLILQCY
ncbi:MAG: DUF1963 domain-containing protein [Methylococcaceae bacterium]|nr:DUF1963 domain-containing protein [Methylococcaceae bacterium]